MKKTYEVCVAVTLEKWYTVEAEDEQDAREIACSKAANIEYDGMFPDEVNAWHCNECEEV